MIFRSDFNIRNTLKAEKDRMKSQASLSSAAGKIWTELDQQTKELYKAKAAKEAHLHLVKHPGYRFNPRLRPKKNNNVCVVSGGGDEM
jgi:hypothetical protein